MIFKTIRVAGIGDGDIVMTTELRQTVTVRRGGWISFRLRELKAGSTAEVVVRLNEPSGAKMTAADLAASGIVGLWSQREDVGESTDFAQRLRQQAQRRDTDNDDPA
jgi:hypothetical protein